MWTTPRNSAYWLQILRCFHPCHSRLGDCTSRHGGGWRNRQAPWLTSLILGLALCFLASAQALAQVYKVGVVPQYDARQIAATWQPILAQVSAISGVQLVLQSSPSIPQFEQQFAQGEYDIAYMNPYHFIVANRLQGYQPLVKDVGNQLYGIIVVRKDSPLQKVTDLDGKTIAFPAPNALGAALIPRAEFSTLFHIHVTPKYVLSHSSVYLNVILGQTAAGGGVQKTLSLQPPEIRDQLRIIYETTKVAAHPVVAHPRVAKEVQQKIQQAFLQLGRTEKGRQLLAKIPMKQIGAATMEDYAPLKQMGLESFYIQE
ncbi:phosphate/phosphite/phosphonate ABC transporter substrate-binding protein [Shewanella sp. YIC-542]|uniref:phosphate/phosphite/phosphonate ABC transporter substrate-binding protein n=1 Tax=Shewanella mytili TaxID=3377111 RepID=UPI00398E5630